MRIVGANSSLKNSLASPFSGTRQQDKLKAQIGNNISGDISTSVISTSIALSKVEDISSTRKKMKGEAGELKSDIELDQSRGASKASLKSKYDKLADYNEKVDQLGDDIGKKLNDINNNISEANKTPESKETTQKTDGKEDVGNDKTDTNDISANHSMKETSDSGKAAGSVSKDSFGNSVLKKGEDGAGIDIKV
jgi:vacuolar-type H+-ATPase subunit I/STV1